MSITVRLQLYTINIFLSSMSIPLHIPPKPQPHYSHCLSTANTSSVLSYIPGLNRADGAVHCIVPYTLHFLGLPCKTGTNLLRNIGTHIPPTRCLIPQNENFLNQLDVQICTLTLSKPNTGLQLHGVHICTYVLALKLLTVHKNFIGQLVTHSQVC